MAVARQLSHGALVVLRERPSLLDSYPRMITTLASCSPSSRLLHPLCALDLSQKCDTYFLRQKGGAPASNGRPGPYTSSGRCSCPQTKRLRFLSTTALAAARLILCYSFIHTGDTTPLSLTDFASAAAVRVSRSWRSSSPIRCVFSMATLCSVEFKYSTSVQISLPERGKFPKHELRTVKFRATRVVRDMYRHLPLTQPESNIANGKPLCSSMSTAIHVVHTVDTTWVSRFLFVRGESAHTTVLHHGSLQSPQSYPPPHANIFNQHDGGTRDDLFSPKLASELLPLLNFNSTYHHHTPPRAAIKL